MGPNIERKKIITKRGLVAPSPDDPARLEEFVPESDRKGLESEIVTKSPQQDPLPSEARGVYHKSTDPLGLTPPPPLDQLQLDESGYRDDDPTLVDSLRELETDPIGIDPLDPEGEATTVEFAARVAAHEDFTPREGSDTEDPEARGRFRTSPGGGLNRISGGREQARAYVSPITVKPGTSTTPVTGAVKVMDIVDKAVRAYKTEPSLLRRRLSSLPSAFGPPKTRMHLLVGAIAIGLVMGAMLFWAAFRNDVFELQDSGQPTKAQPSAARPAAPKKQKISRNESETGPKTQAAGAKEATPPGATKGQQKAPSDTEEKTVTPSLSPPSPVHEEAPVVNLPRSDTKPAVRRATPAETAAPPEKPVGAGEAKKPSSQDLWLQ
jgi:hypothetical protein